MKLFSIISKLFVTLCVLFLLGCKTCKPIVEIRDSVRVEFRHDSVYVYQHDSIFRDRWRNGDTVFVTTEKWRTLYKDKIVEIHDTIRTNEQTVQNVEIVPKFYKNCTIAMWIIVTLIALAITARILIKIYLHK